MNVRVARERTVGSTAVVWRAVCIEVTGLSTGQFAKEEKITPNAKDLGTREIVECLGDQSVKTGQGISVVTSPCRCVPAEAVGVSPTESSLSECSLLELLGYLEASGLTCSRSPTCRDCSQTLRPPA